MQKKWNKSGWKRDGLDITTKVEVPGRLYKLFFVAPSRRRATNLECIIHNKVCKFDLTPLFEYKELLHLLRLSSGTLDLYSGSSRSEFQSQRLPSDFSSFA